MASAINMDLVQPKIKFLKNGYLHIQREELKNGLKDFGILKRINTNGNLVLLLQELNKYGKMPQEIILYFFLLQFN